PGPGRVEIHPRHARTRESLGHEPFELLGARTPAMDRGAPARGALGGDVGAVIAVMTPQVLRIMMQGQRDAARRTIDHGATGGTLDERRPPATIEEQED